MQSDSSLARALALVRDLRARCPWDRAQTRQTLRPYLVEEVLELDQALRHDDVAALRDELGDLLLHLAFQIVIGEEQQQLDAESITRALEEKMWRRHPQLFAGAEGPDHAGWERVKRREQRAQSSTLRGLPPTLPPLLMAYRLQERAAGVGFDWPDARGPLDKVKEEIGELERATGDGERETIEDEIGDLLFAVVNLARKLEVDPRAALEKANEKFRSRFEQVERLAAARGLDLGRASLATLDGLWEQVKRG
ncbi:MAG TPA: nucleoside triphosphate pyrophosphohydrolase [Gemmatimonadales bacterium]|nr:nucleoside triphosphate pyrophosphohydrolase [Gemmatimonadales bacterium]